MKNHTGFDGNPVVWRRTRLFSCTISDEMRHAPLRAGIGGILEVEEPEDGSTITPPSAKFQNNNIHK